MKVTNTTEKNFQPFTLSFTVESENEARALYAIFNHTKNTELLKGLGVSCESIREVIGKEFAAKYGSYITPDVNYEYWYK